MTRKTWSYKQLTDQLEREIIYQAKFLAEQRLTLAAKEWHACQLQIGFWLNGSYSFWDRLTDGWRRSGEGDRIKALIQNIVDSPYEMNLPAQQLAANPAQASRVVDDSSTLDTARDKAPHLRNV